MPNYARVIHVVGVYCVYNVVFTIAFNLCMCQNLGSSAVKPFNVGSVIL